MLVFYIIRVVYFLVTSKKFVGWEMQNKYSVKAFTWLLTSSTPDENDCVLYLTKQHDKVVNIVKICGTVLENKCGHFSLFFFC